MPIRKGCPTSRFRTFVENKNSMSKKTLKLIKDDPWLEDSTQDIEDRYNRYLQKLENIKNDFGSLSKMADGYLFLGINFDSKRNGWGYREWAPEAKALYLVGDFNNWEQFSHPLTKNEHGIWEIFLEKEKYQDSFVSGSNIKVLVDSKQGMN